MTIYTPDNIKRANAIVNRLNPAEDLALTANQLSGACEGCAELSYLVAHFASERGAHNPALECLSHLEASNTALAGYARAARGFILIRKHDFSGAEECLRQALDLGPEPGEELRAVVASTHAAALFHGGNTEAARDHLYEGIRLTGESDFLRARILDTLGMYYAHQHDFHAASELYTRAITVKRAFDDQAGVALSLGQLGRLFLDWGQLDRALSYFMEDKDLCAQIGDRRGEAQMHNMIGQVYLAKRNWRSAADWLTEAICRCDEGAWSVLAGFARKDLALALIELGNTSQAEAVLAEAMDLFTQTGVEFEEGIAHIWRGQSKITERQGRYDEAEMLLRKSVRWFLNHHELAEAARCKLQLAALLRGRGVPVTMFLPELRMALELAEQGRRDLLIQEIENELQQVDLAAYQMQVYRRIRGRTVGAGTSSLIAGTLASGSVIFLDVQGSTDFARLLDPSTVMMTLNRLIASFETALTKYDAQVTTYMGDGFMALVLGTDHARRAVAAAMDMILSAREFNQPRELLRMRQLRIRVGIATGEICLGNVGTYQKMDYTGIGTTVNLAARIQSEAEVEVPCICRATRDMVQDSYEFKFAEGRPVQMRGLGMVQVWDVVRRKVPG